MKVNVSFDIEVGGDSTFDEIARVMRLKYMLIPNSDKWREFDGVRLGNVTNFRCDKL